MHIVRFCPGRGDSREICVSAYYTRVYILIYIYYIFSFFGFLQNFQVLCRNKKLSPFLPVFCHFSCVLHSQYLKVFLYSVWASLPGLSPLGLFEFGFHTFIRPISPFDLHARTAQPIHALLKVPTMLGSLYSSSTLLLLQISYSPSLFLFGPNIFLNTFLSNTSDFFPSNFLVAQVLLTYKATGSTIYINIYFIINL